MSEQAVNTTMLAIEKLNSMCQTITLDNALIVGRYFFLISNHVQRCVVSKAMRNTLETRLRHASIKLSMALKRIDVTYKPVDTPVVLRVRVSPENNGLILVSVNHSIHRLTGKPDVKPDEKLLAEIDADLEMLRIRTGL